MLAHIITYHCIHLTIILRNRAEYRWILSRRGHVGLNQAIFRKIVQDNCLLFNKLITKLTILSGQEKTLLFTVKLVAAYKITYMAGYLLPTVRMTDIERIITIFGQCYNVLNNKYM